MGGIVSDLLPIATTGFGIATGNPALIASGVGMLGSQQAGQSAQQASQQTAQMSQFRPVGITTRFGSSGFQFDPTGKLSGAGYSLSPESQAVQNQLAGMTGTGLMQGGQIQSLAGQYLGESPEAVRQRIMKQRMDLLAPSRERELAKVLNTNFQTGTGGLAVGGTGLRPGGGEGLRASNPRLEAYYNALAQSDLQSALEAETAAQNQIKFGQGLASGAYEPFKAGFGAMTSVENEAQRALGLGSELGGLSSSAAARAAPYQYSASAYNPVSNYLANPALQKAIGTGLSGLFSATPQLQSEVSALGSSTWNPFSDYNTGANGWGNYGE